MDDGRRQQDQRPDTMEPWDGDGLTREPLPPDPRSPRSPWASWALPQATGARVLLGALAALLVVTVVGTSALVVRDLRLQATGTSPVAQATAQATATVTVVSGTPTPTPARDPKDNGWTQLGQVGYPDDLQFSATSPQRGYLCGSDISGRIVFGVTTDGGQTWTLGTSPAANDECSIQVSATNALDVALSSHPGTCGGSSCFTFDAHYSTDGGKSWKAAPIPPNVFWLGGGLWSGPYLYVWAQENGAGAQLQQSFLKVSANGGVFTSINLNTLPPGAQNVNIASAVASGTKLYLNLIYTGCLPPTCLAIVASGDGGKTWVQVPNQSSIRLEYVVGNTLYGQRSAGATTTIARSTDNGATWTPMAFPPLPDGETLSLSHPRSWRPIPDGTIFTASSSLGVAYLRFGGWAIIPFWSYAPDAIVVSLDTNGQPQRIWGLISPQVSAHGIYWHPLP